MREALPFSLCGLLSREELCSPRVHFGFQNQHVTALSHAAERHGLGALRASVGCHGAINNAPADLHARHIGPLHLAFADRLVDLELGLVCGNAGYPLPIRADEDLLNRRRLVRAPAQAKRNRARDNQPTHYALPQYAKGRKASTQPQDEQRGVRP